MQITPQQLNVSFALTAQHLYGGLKQLINSHAVLASLPLCPLSQEAPLDSCWPHSRQKAPSQIESKQDEWADESVSSWRRVAGYCIWWALFVHPTLEAQCQTPNAKHCQQPLPVTGPERI